MEFLNKVAVKSLLEKSHDCLIGVSGGIDSMVLLDWLAKHADYIGVNIRAMHVDHGIHPDSPKWAAAAQDACIKVGIRCEIRKVNLDGLGNNLEYAARQARYKAFCDSGADTLILAHHANDQCESFLLKLFRGSGVKGLKAMSPATQCWYDKNVTVVRPMLGVTRGQIEAWAGINGISNIDDPSNLDTKYDRNYVRNKVWPVIKDRFDIADLNAVRSIQHLGESWELNNILADLDISSVTIRDGVLDWQKTRQLGYLRIKNMLLRILDQQNVYGFSVGHIEQFVQGLVDANMDSKNELSLKNFTINKIGKKIYINTSISKEKAA